MENRKIKTLLLRLLGAGIIGVGAALYLINMPHWDVKKAKTDLKIDAAALIARYQADAVAANQYFLSEDGNSHVLDVSGILLDLSTDYAGNTQLRMGTAHSEIYILVSLQAGETVTRTQVGSPVRIKGAITSGAEFDADFGAYSPITISEGIILKP
ncbi:MAG: hypothetical protein ACK417_05130 [Bacteroidia bacterium]